MQLIVTTALPEFNDDEFKSFLKFHYFSSANVTAT